MPISSQYLCIRVSYTPVEVKYKKTRPQPLSGDFSNADKFHHYIYQQLTTKSKEWRYEKEYRCIIPMGWFDYFNIKEGSELALRMREFGTDELLRKENKMWETRHKDSNEQLLALMVNSYTEEKDALYFKKINKKSIESIHLGYRLNPKHRQEIISHISQEQNGLSHVKIYQCVPSPDKFKIISPQIYAKDNPKNAAPTRPPNLMRLALAALTPNPSD